MLWVRPVGRQRDGSYALSVTFFALSGCSTSSNKARPVGGPDRRNLRRDRAGARNRPVGPSRRVRGCGTVGCCVAPRRSSSPEFLTASRKLGSSNGADAGAWRPCGLRCGDSALHLAPPPVRRLGWVRPSPLVSLSVIAVLAVANALLEEVLWRFLVYEAVMSAAIPGPGMITVIIQAIGFGLAHRVGLPGGFSGMVGAGAFGMLQGILRLRHRTPGISFLSTLRSMSSSSSPCGSPGPCSAETDSGRSAAASLCREGSQGRSKEVADLLGAETLPNDLFASGLPDHQGPRR